MLKYEQEKTHNRFQKDKASFTLNLSEFPKVRPLRAP
jgi:hypothetical protein